MHLDSSRVADVMAYLEPRLDRFLDELEQLCAIDTKSGYASGIDETVTWITRWAEARGWQVRTWPDDEAGAGIAVTIQGSPGGLRLMHVIHHDTVYPVGTATGRPRRREGDHLVGPGTSDAKSGLLASLYAMAALEDLDLLANVSAISLVSTPDEEVDMRVSRVMLEELAPEYDLALSVEAATPAGEIASARKGGATYEVVVTGAAAHASRPEEGANAIQALAHQVIAIQSLHAFRPEVTVNVGVIEGGTADNVVPDRARAIVDVRMTGHDGDVEAIEEAMSAIGQHPYVPGTVSKITRELFFPPMPATPRVLEMAEVAVQCAASLGFPLRYGPKGGITLANLLAGHGIPALDGLGPVGGAEHSEDEYLDVTSVVPRIGLLTLLSASLARDFSRQ